MPLLQTTTANSKPSEMTVRTDSGHRERAKNATRPHPFQKAGGSRATSCSLSCLQQLSGCCSCSLSLCICPQHSLLISLTDEATGESDKRPGSGSSKLPSCQKGGRKAPCKSASRDVVSENHAQRAGESPSSHPTASTAILLDCLNTWGSGGSADKPPQKCYTWGYRHCRQDDLPGARARLGPAPAHPSRAGSLNFCSCCGSQKGGRIWLKGRLALQPMHTPVWSTANTFSSKAK